MSDGSHTFTADATHSSINVLGWNLGSLSVTPPSNSDVDFALTGTAMPKEGASGRTASAWANLIVTVNPVADAPTVTAAPATGNEDSAIALSISAALRSEERRVGKESGTGGSMHD